MVENSRKKARKVGCQITVTPAEKELLHIWAGHQKLPCTKNGAPVGGWGALFTTMARKLGLPMKAHVPSDVALDGMPSRAIMKELTLLGVKRPVDRSNDALKAALSAKRTEMMGKRTRGKGKTTLANEASMAGRDIGSKKKVISCV